MEHTGIHRDAILIINTQSRRGQQLYERAKHEIIRRGITLSESYPVRDASRIPAVVTEAAAKGHCFIIVGGGDGTISAAASSLAQRDAVLGLLPMGTANNFARANRIPLDLTAAIDVLLSGRAARVDLSRVDDRTCFTNAVSIGITSAIHRGSPDQLKRHLGRVGYLLAAARQLAACKPFECRLLLDGTLVEMTALDVRIANGPFQGGLSVVGDASVNSGDLAVRVITARSQWDLGRVWLGTGMGRTDNPALVQTFRAREIEVFATPQQHVSVDGEGMTRTPARVCVAPAALRLMVPAFGRESS
ncbi:diacylglycerol/lipid kinase family protein [Microvirga sp. M2]|uniref:diacylglycerol/lipid kinase family protein n=1 Tax=Microvirga sp. M2 TaxID=3073270 RepID=UPI0039C4E076